MPMNSVNKELADYLKSKEGLTRLMNKLKEKYISLSRPSGTVTLNNLTEIESIDISNLLGKRIYKEDNFKISFREITKKINEGRYSDFTWQELLNDYFNENIITKEEEILTKKQEEIEFYNNIYEKNKDREYIEIIKEIMVNDEIISKIIKQKYHKNRLSLQEEINNILLLLDNIPEYPTSLAVYASLTGNPHYLDLNKNTSTLFLKILSRIKQIEYEEKLESKINILSEINVYTDPISNFVITYKLTGNSILNELAKNNEVVNLNLLNINKLSKVDTNNKIVYVFENPSLLTSLIDLNVPIIITSGIPNISLYTLLKKLEKSNTKIYYNGDFDPEGLLIAEKLKQRFPNIELFCYSDIDYNNAKSKEKISNTRLKKLDNINSKELKDMKNIILENKVSAYQEQNLDRIRKYIEKSKL